MEILIYRQGPGRYCQLVFRRDHGSGDAFSIMEGLIADERISEPGRYVFTRKTSSVGTTSVYVFELERPAAPRLVIRDR